MLTLSRSGGPRGSLAGLNPLEVSSHPKVSLSSLAVEVLICFTGRTGVLDSGTEISHRNGLFLHPSKAAVKPIGGVCGTVYQDRLIDVTM